MKYFIIILLSLSIISCYGSTSLKKDSTDSKKIEKLAAELQKTKQELFDKTILAYQQTNDRLNNYVTITGVVATIFGVIIAFGGIWIGFESLRSQKKKDDAIKILENAKNYVEDKKSDFNQLIEKKIGELEKDYKKIIEIAKDRLFEDINNETLQVKELAEKKTQEIEKISIQEKKDEALEKLQKRIEFFENIGIPDDPQILLSKAKLFRGKDMYKEAIELLLKVVAKQPNNSDAFWELGWNYSKINETSKSIESYQESIKHKDNSSSHNNIAVEFEKKNKLYDAIKEYELAIKLDPKNKLYHRNKAKILLKLNSIEPAIETYKQIIEIDEKDIESYLDIIKLFQNQSRNNDALEYYDLAILNIPEKTQELNYSKGVYLSKIDRKNEAYTLFQNLLVLNFKTEECLQLCAQIKLDLGEKSEAIKILDSINELNIKNPFPYNKKAEIFFEEDPDKAMEIIEEGLKHISTPEFLLNSARVFSKNKTIDLAKKLQLKAIELLNEKVKAHAESDIMNLYETNIIVDDYSAANTTIKNYGTYVKSSKYIIVKEFLKVCLNLLENMTVDFNNEIEKFKYLKSETSEKTHWNFDDIKHFIDSKSQFEKYKMLNLLIDYVEEKITYEEYLSNLQK